MMLKKTLKPVTQDLTSNVFERVRVTVGGGVRGFEQAQSRESVRVYVRENEREIGDVLFGSHDGWVSVLPEKCKKGCEQVSEVPELSLLFMITSD
jgi:hypothetical protein